MNGAGDYCWFTTTAMAYVNSWNLAELTINGADYTNAWSSSLPPAENGGWTIHYAGNYPWSHFEAPQAKNATIKKEDDIISQNDSKLVLSPNPVYNKLTLSVSNWNDPVNVAIYSSYGSLVQRVTLNNSTREINMGNLESGLYIIKLRYDNKTITRKIIKN